MNYILSTTDFVNYVVQNSNSINLPRISAKVIGKVQMPKYDLNMQIEVEEFLDLDKVFRGELGSNRFEEEVL